MVTQSTSGGTLSAELGIATQIIIQWPAHAVLGGRNMVLELSGAFTLSGSASNMTTFLLAPAVAGNTGRTMLLNGWVPTVVDSKPGAPGLVTFPPGCVVVWNGGLAGPFNGLCLQAVGYMGLS